MKNVVTKWTFDYNFLVDRIGNLYLAKIFS